MWALKRALKVKYFNFHGTLLFFRFSLAFLLFLHTMRIPLLFSLVNANSRKQNLGDLIRVCRFDTPCSSHDYKFTHASVGELIVLFGRERAGCDCVYTFISL